MTWSEKIKAVKASGVNLDLSMLIALAISHEFTPAELTQVRITLIADEFLAQNPRMRRNRAEALIGETMRKAGFLKTETHL